MNKNNISVSRRIYWSLTGYISAMLILVLALSSYLFITHHKKQLANNVESIAHIIGTRSLDFLTTDQAEELSKSLERLERLPNIDQIYIFKIDPITQEETIFSRYKKYPDTPSFTINFDRIKHIKHTEFKGATLEFALPIELKQELVGYIYVHGNFELIRKNNLTIIQLLSLLVFCAITLSLVIAYLLIKVIKRPFASISDSVIEVAQKKDYQLSCPSQSFLEAEILTKNINLLYVRTLKLLKKHEKTIATLEQQNTELDNKVSTRTDALKESNNELLSTLEQLHQYQEQLVENEKMASLGDLVAGVAHEVNTPIGLGVTASTLMLDKLDSLQADFENKSLKSSQLSKYIVESQENLQIIVRNLNRAANLISSFKQVAVDQSVEDEREFNVKQLIDEVFLTLSPKIKSHAYTLHLSCDENLVIKSKPSPITQVFINLIINSFIHAFEDTTDAEITINIRATNNRLTINYSDNGSGIPAHIKDKIFEPFTTTKRGEGGSGLGMHLVYNLVTQALKGTIQLADDRNIGATFNIDFPIEILTKSD